MQKNKRLNQSQKAHIYSMIAGGYSNKQIAETVGVVHQHVNYYRKLLDQSPVAPPEHKEKLLSAMGKTAVAKAAVVAIEGPRILVLDIETLPLESYTWGLFDQNVGLNQIKRDWSALSYAAKYIGEDHVYYDDTRNQSTIRDDRDIIAAICALLDECDIVVGQNVKKFDLRKVRARAIMHGLAPFREPLVQDTMLMARSVGSFTSNKLEYLTDKLTTTKKLKHKDFPGFDLWLGVMQGNEAAWESMKEYNMVDILSTEELYLKLRPWVRNHPNMSLFYKDENKRCPRCGSVNVYPTEVEYKGVSEYQGYCCRDCGGHSRSRFTLNSKGKRKNLLTCI